MSHSLLPPSLLAHGLVVVAVVVVVGGGGDGAGDGRGSSCSDRLADYLYRPVIKQIAARQSEPVEQPLLRGGSGTHTHTHE